MSSTESMHPTCSLLPIPVPCITCSACLWHLPQAMVIPCIHMLKQNLHTFLSMFLQKKQFQHHQTIRRSTSKSYIMNLETFPRLDTHCRKHEFSSSSLLPFARNFPTTIINKYFNRENLFTNLDRVEYVTPQFWIVCTSTVRATWHSMRHAKIPMRTVATDIWCQYFVYRRVLDVRPWLAGRRRRAMAFHAPCKDPAYENCLKRWGSYCTVCITSFRQDVLFSFFFSFSRTTKHPLFLW